MEKVNVVNPITYFTTVGEEIEEILSSNEISVTEFKQKVDWAKEGFSTIEKISKPQAKEVETITGVEKISSYLLDFQVKYKAAKVDSIEVFKKHSKIYKKVEHLRPLLRGEFTDGIDALEDIANFLDIDEEAEILERVKENIALYKISNFTPDDLNLYAWLKRGELDFYKKDLEDYDKNKFLEWLDNGEWMKSLRNNSNVHELPQILEKFGVGLVYTPYLDKTVFGAVRWFNNKPLVQISDKGKCLATFWYTLFHEFGHVIEHENDEIFEGQADLTKSAITKKEKEANAFAYKYLFNGDNLRKHIFGFRNEWVDDGFIYDKARRFNVNPMFVAFWMKKAGVRHRDIHTYIPSFQINI
ncbi:ImmA/IrrE family metallo-endopeptidase [Flavobacterium sp. PLA-1-15]|uniref:ImmA/IrrE family metallo-endopeptidase n=1 Tax=Flavobacterium sp. PLA-1-15 TaxID=3380533 RepID=UPI003B76D7B8